MNCVKQWLFFAGALMFSAAQPAVSFQLITGPATFAPSNPTAADQIRATFLGPGLCATTPSTVVTGTVVRTTVSISGCITGPPAFQESRNAFFGPLQAGTYSYELYEIDNPGDPPQFVSTQPLVVAPATIPGLRPAGLLTLVFALAGAGWLVLKK
jgi:hypothetical protein